MGVRCVIDDFRLILKKKAPTPFGPISGPNDVGARDCFGGFILTNLKRAVSTSYGRSPCSRRIFSYPPPATVGIEYVGYEMSVFG